jgi:hypothetical protein
MYSIAWVCIRVGAGSSNSRSLARSIEGKLARKKRQTEVSRDPGNYQKQQKYECKFDDGLRSSI